MSQPPIPTIGDKVVIDGTSYRIRLFSGPTGSHAFLAHAGPSWRRTSIVANVAIARLRWERIPAIWRADAVGG